MSNGIEARAQFFSDNDSYDDSDFSQLFKLMDGSVSRQKSQNLYNDQIEMENYDPHLRLLRLPPRDQILIINAINEIEDQRTIIEKKYKNLLAVNTKLEKEREEIENKYITLERKYNQVQISVPIHTPENNYDDDAWAKYTKIKKRYTELLKQCVKCIEIDPVTMGINFKIDENMYKIVLHLFSNLRIMKKYDNMIRIDGNSLSQRILGFIKQTETGRINTESEIEYLEGLIYEELKKINRGHGFTGDIKILNDAMGLFFNMIKHKKPTNDITHDAILGIGCAITHIQIQGHVQYLSDKISLNDQNNMKIRGSDKKMRKLLKELNRRIALAQDTNLFKEFILKAGKLINQNNHEIIKIYSYVQQSVFNIIIGAILGSSVSDINVVNTETSDFFAINEQKICDTLNSDKDQCIKEWETMIDNIKSKILYSECDVDKYLSNLLINVTDISEDRKKIICWAKVSGPKVIDILAQSIPRVIRHALNVNEESIVVLLFATKKS